MKNIGVRYAFGPLPARTVADDLPPARAAILRALDGQPEATSIAALAAVTGLHGNTVREHLEALATAGLVDRLRAAPQGRGRPAWLYTSPAGAQGAAGGDREYAALAAALARVIHRSSDHPAEDAALAGEEWGRELARSHGTADQAAARRVVVDILADVGFAPETDPDPAGAGDPSGALGPRAADRTDVRLTRCPLLAAAHEHPDVVCGVHLGLVRGALSELAAPAAEVTLVPFAEPGACRLTMRHGRGGAR